MLMQMGKTMTCFVLLHWSRKAMSSRQVIRRGKLIRELLTVCW